MDRRYLLAFVFSLLILLAYPHYLKWIGVAPKERVIYHEKQIENVTEAVKSNPSPQAFRAETDEFKNPIFHILFTNLGGSILSLTQDDATLFAAQPQDKVGIFATNILNGSEDLTQQVFSKAPAPKENAPPSFSYEKLGEYRLTKTFFVGSEKPSIVLQIDIENLSNRERQFPLTLQYALYLGTHTGRDDSMIKAVAFSETEMHSASLAALRKKPVLSTDPIEWHGLVRKYYALLVKPDWKSVSQETQLEGDQLVSELKFAPLSVAPGQKETARVLIYAGPQSYDLLKSFGVGFEKIFSHGMLGVFKVWLLKGLNFFHHVTRNYGVAILIITLLIKLLFTPLTHVSYQSMGKMQALQPKVKALQKNYEKDPTRLNKELMELYRRNRVNPMMGCLPLVLQIPIFIAFYQVLSQAVELKGANFIFWIRDLSEPDRLFTLPTSLPFIGNAINLLPFFMIGSMLWQQKLTPQTAAAPGQEKLMYLTPVIFGFVFYNLPSGLVLYWFVNNMLTIFHQLVIKRIPVILHHEDR